LAPKAINEEEEESDDESDDDDDDVNDENNDDANTENEEDVDDGVSDTEAVRLIEKMRIAEEDDEFEKVFNTTTTTNINNQY